MPIPILSFQDVETELMSYYQWMLIGKLKSTSTSVAHLLVDDIIVSVIVAAEEFVNSCCVIFIVNWGSNFLRALFYLIDNVEIFDCLWVSLFVC